MLTRRNLVHIRREPLQLSDVTVQPVLFTLLFIYVFGSGIPIAGGSYKDFALAGLLLLNLTTSAMGTAVGLEHRPHHRRHRPVPHAAHVAVGRPRRSLDRRRPGRRRSASPSWPSPAWPSAGGPTPASAVGASAGFAVALLFSYALSWGCACLGIVSKGPESAQSMGLIILFPLAIVSNAMVPTQGMPGWLQTIADWNPVSAVTAACRHLFGNPNPSGSIHAWPMQHPVLGRPRLVGRCILAVFAPLAASLYRRRTTG